MQGGEQIKAAYPREACTVFVLPPNAAELERRLRGRDTDSEEVIQRRLAAARSEIARGLGSYEYVVVNDVLELAYERVAAILRHARATLGGVEDAQAAEIAASCRRAVASTGEW